MPGLAGVWEVSATGLADQAGRMALRLGRPGVAARTEMAAEIGCAMAADFAGRGYGVRVASDGLGHVAGLDGEIEMAASDPDLVAHPARELLRRYRAEGAGFVSRLRGAFSLALFDDRRSTLVLATDPCGLRPLYYRKSGRRVVFASCVRALLEDPSLDWTPDLHGIADFLVLGFPLETRTLLRGVVRVPPATLVTFDGGDPVSTTYWDLRFDAGDEPPMGLDDAAGRLRDVLSAAVERPVPRPDAFDVPLSGGLDSRCLAAAARTLDRPVRTYTIGSAGRLDLVLGPLVARTLDCPNRTWTLEASDFLGWIEEAVYLTDGMYSPFDAPILSLARRLPEDTRVILDGTNSFDGVYRFFEPALAAFHRPGRDLRRLTLRILGKPLVDRHGIVAPGLFAPDFLDPAQRCVRASLERLIEEARGHAAAGPFDGLDYLDLRHRVPRYNIMGTVLLRAFCEVRHPFFDPDVMALVTRLPAALRTREKRVQGRMLSLLAPSLARIEYERTGLPADSCLARHAGLYARLAAGRALGAACPFAPLQPRTAIDYPQWMAHDRALQEYLRDVLLDPASLRRGYVSPPSIEALLAAAFRAEPGPLPLVGRLLALELWHRFFLEAHGPTSARPAYATA